ncbi:MAG: hypothetical protein A2Y07_02455 [Planctomycetes bacterium GWF2_50_10]|nr:MAG: hypothetical protein A2Y07_02455 [Planctomycetes bacterium GWF2_50_10]
MRILLINPPVYDFTAHDFWLKPYGMLTAAATLGPAVDLTLFDFLDRQSTLMPAVKENHPDPFGRGKLFQQIIPKPAPLANIPRKYYRFGIPQTAFHRWLTPQPPPDAVLIQTVMTYWYPGIKEVIDDLRRITPRAKIVLGGPYATICPSHSATLGPDLVISGPNLHPLYHLLNINPSITPIPWHLYPILKTGAMTITRGCPYRCTYCAAAAFGPTFQIKPLADVIAEFDLLAARGVKDIAFYDDALLFQAEKTLMPFLKYARSSGVNFHTPNAVHARFLTPAISAALVDGGFKTFHIGFESNAADWHKTTGQKVLAEDFTRAVKNLLTAGANPRHITAYIMLGHPQTQLQAIEDSLKFVADLGIRSMLAEFSPIPGTPDAVYAEKLVDLTDPLNHNKTAWPITFLGEQKVNHLKELCKSLNRSAISNP